MVRVRDRDIVSVWYTSRDMVMVSSIVIGSHRSRFSDRIGLVLNLILDLVLVLLFVLLLGLGIGWD
jgi:hypothetical protein